MGISVEFVSHITCAFAHSTKPDRVERAAEATVDMGSKVVAGVAMTYLPGIVVLAFTKEQLIQIFFHLNLIIILVGLATWRPSPWVLAGDMTADMEGDTAGDTAASAEQGVGLALSNPCFEDKDEDKDETTAPRQG